MSLLCKWFCGCTEKSKEQGDFLDLRNVEEKIRDLGYRGHAVFYQQRAPNGDVMKFWGAHYYKCEDGWEQHRQMVEKHPSKLEAMRAILKAIDK